MGRLSSILWAILRYLVRSLYRLGRSLFPSSEPPTPTVTAAKVTLVFTDGRTEDYRPEQARQIGYEMEAHEAERLWVESLVTQRGYTSDEAWELVAEERELFKDGTWKKELKRWREAEAKFHKMSEAEAIGNELAALRTGLDALRPTDERWTEWLEKLEAVGQRLKELEDRKHPQHAQYSRLRLSFTNLVGLGMTKWLGVANVPRPGKKLSQIAHDYGLWRL